MTISDLLQSNPLQRQCLESLDVLRGFDLLYLLSMFAGHVLKDSEPTPLHKSCALAYIGDFYPTLIAIGGAVIIYQTLRVMYRQQVFLKV